MKTILTILLLIATLSANAHTMQPPKVNFVWCVEATITVVFVSVTGSLCCSGYSYVGSNGGGGQGVNCWLTQNPPESVTALGFFDTTDANSFWQGYYLSNYAEVYDAYVSQHGVPSTPYISVQIEQTIVGYTGNTLCMIKAGNILIRENGFTKVKIVRAT